MSEQISEKQNNLPAEVEDKKIEKQVNRLVKALDRVYGNSWSIIWRNFLAGLTHAIGATVGYALFLGITILIAEKLGVFSAVRSFWQELPFNQLNQTFGAT